ncbi:MAG: SUMF1/EgtB/PvdO family nonheme iron enzyme [Cyanobacteria bacterium J06592_8]
MVSTSKNSLKDSLHYALHRCRLMTLKQLEGIDETTFRAQPHPDFSPVGWHFGHIAYTEALWLLETCGGLKSLFPEYHQLFQADGLPKSDRVQLPSISSINGYLEAIRGEIWRYLDIAPLEEQERLWRFILQHESQHSETIALVLQLNHLQNSEKTLQIYQPSAAVSPHLKTLRIPAGSFAMGSNSIEAMDNEKPLHRQYLDTYWIDRYPVTCSQYRIFMQAGGYENREYWSIQGWQWLQQNPVSKPLYWREDPIFDDHPVCGVNWYEAEAYCKFVGKRLPTEAEWEKAASWDEKTQSKRTYPWGEERPNSNTCNCNDGQRLQQETTSVNAYADSESAYGVRDLLGNVWEWTGSWFTGYSGFQHYPYVGYSQTYFDHQHRVLKGGSWATRPWAMRCSFRNWYHPGVREILAGFRCVSQGE